MSDELPSTWVTTLLSELLVALESGSRPRGGVRGISEGVPSVGGEHLKYDGGFDFGAVKFVPDHFASEMTNGRIQTNDVLIVKDGATTGKTAFVDSTFPFRNAVVNEHVFICRPTREIEPRFLFRFLMSKDGQERVLENFKGSAQGGINQTFAPNTVVPLAPLGEQRRIVAKLEQVLGKVEACHRRLAKIPALLKRFRQSVLAAACSGRLTADWRKENPAAEDQKSLLEQAQTYRESFWRRAGRKGRCPEISEPDTSSLPELPQGWSWIPLGILETNPFQTVQTGPFGALLHSDEFVPSGVPVVAVGNLTGMGFTKRGLYFVPEAKAEQLSRFDIQAGDVLFARSGATLGKVCVAPPEAKDWRMTGHILRVRPNRVFVLPDYCVFALRGDPAVTRQVFGSVQGTTRPGYNTTLLESISLPIAPLPEQQEIVRRVEALFALADKIEARYATAQAQVDRLTPSLLARAFAGKLVPQDPTDEPASVLLERIRKEWAGKSGSRQLASRMSKSGTARG